MTNQTQKKSVIIVGGGWAGLSCAIELGRLGHQVTVLESARQLGGRARRVPFDEHTVDNGQHIMLGAYRHTLSLFKRLNIPVDELLERTALNMHLQDKAGKRYQFTLPALLTPLNLLFGIVLARGFKLRDRLAALRFGLKLFTNSALFGNDMSVEDLLRKEKQTQTLIKVLWEPICLASLNTPIEEASAHIFIRVLHDAFCRSHKDADFIVPKTDLSTLFPDPASDFIEQHNGTIHLSKRVTKINIDKRHIVSVECDSETFHAEHVVLAIPPYACLPLIKDHPALHDIAYNFNSFSYNPIVTVYLKYPESVQPDFPIQSLIGTTAQWVFHRKLNNQSHLMAVVISGPGPHMQLDNAQLAEQIQNELSEIFPHWPRADSIQIFREKRATFSARVGIDALRPNNKTCIHGLWFAGDFTKTSYPATLESAIQSGHSTAHEIQQLAVNSV